MDNKIINSQNYMCKVIRFISNMGVLPWVNGRYNISGEHSLKFISAGNCHNCLNLINVCSATKISNPVTFSLFFGSHFQNTIVNNVASVTNVIWNYEIINLRIISSRLRQFVALSGIVSIIKLCLLRKRTSVFFILFSYFKNRILTLKPIWSLGHVRASIS